MRCLHGRLHCRVCGGADYEDAKRRQALAVQTALAANSRPSRVQRLQRPSIGHVKSVKLGPPRNAEEQYQRDLERNRALWLSQHNMTTEDFQKIQDTAHAASQVAPVRNAYGSIIPRAFGTQKQPETLEEHIARSSAERSQAYLKQQQQAEASKPSPSSLVRSAFGILSSATTALASTDMPPNAQRAIDVSKNIRIIRIEVQRAPIAKALNAVLQLISAGQWNKAKDSVGVDTLFHLCLHINGSFQFEKEARVGFKSPIDKRIDGETMSVPIVHSLTIGELVENAKRAMGVKFYTYDAFSNNCQDFVLGVLAASNLLTPQLHDFIKQPASALLNHNPSYLSAVARTATNLGNIVDRVAQGGQRRRLHARGPKSRKYGGKKHRRGGSKKMSEAMAMGFHLGKHLHSLHGGSFHKQFAEGVCRGGAWWDFLNPSKNGVGDAFNKVKNEFVNPDSTLRGQVIPKIGNEFTDPNSVLRGQVIPIAGKIASLPGVQFIPGIGQIASGIKLAANVNTAAKALGFGH